MNVGELIEELRKQDYSKLVVLGQQRGEGAPLASVEGKLRFYDNRTGDVYDLSTDEGEVDVYERDPDNSPCVVLLAEDL